MAIQGLNYSGTAKVAHKPVQGASSLNELTKAMPSNEPNSAWVVEVGIPSQVARNIVIALPNAIAIISSGLPRIASGIIPSPLTTVTSLPAKNTEPTQPAAVAIVAQSKVFLKLVVPLPYRVATPLKLSLAPLLYDSQRTPIITKAIAI